MLCSIFALVANGQDIVACSYVDNLPRKEPLPINVRERMMELCIEENKKEFKELIDKSEKIAQLSNEIENSYTEHKKFSKEDKKKLKEVEKLVKKIRRELNANNKGSDDKDEFKPSSTMEAIKDLQKNTNEFLSEIKKTTRHTISATAIQSSNVVLKIVKFLRFSK